ncbi:MAG: glutathione S-transferase [Gammaproteobacteria bacterium]|nr:MAG: glutathione S-transferase [Gammaproteobacteria bacterium]
MSEIILHHYALSPFAEKIRAMFGYLNLEWQSALTSEMPPRPLLEPLTGGYRRIPVAQIGADIYCDTQTISSQLAKISGKSQLCTKQCDMQVNEFVALVEGDFFFASILYASGIKLNKKIMAQMSFFNLAKLLLDRLKMVRNAATKTAGIKESKQIVNNTLSRIEDQLEQSFLFGPSPNIADFSAYHPVWFIKDLGEKSIMEHFPKTNAWAERIREFGEGTRKEISGEEALSIARAHQPTPIENMQKTHDLIGQLVQIAPCDYGLRPSSGVLEACTEHQYIISREPKETGLIHIHFPREGYQVKQAV